MLEPKPESRIKALENRASIIEATLIELSSDTAEELKAIRQSIQTNFDELKQTLKDKASFAEMDEQFKAVATKEDLTKLETGLRNDMATKDDITRLENLIKQLLQQKQGE